MTKTPQPEKKVSAALTLLSSRLERGDLNLVDVHFADLMARLADNHDPALIHLFASLSRAVINQHTCLNLTGQSTLVGKLLELSIVQQGQFTDLTPLSDPAPLVLRQQMLFLQRLDEIERRIALAFKTRNQAIEPRTAALKMLHKLFPDSPDINWQKIAAYQALNRKLCLVTGGPGTGKTSTVMRIVAALLAGQPDLVIRLAAPTGKAAMRLSESLIQNRGQLPADSQGLPTEVTTLHRLLGVRGDGNGFRYNAQNLLEADLVIIDEVSMVDLRLFDHLLLALPENCQLILLGDPDQLPSVDSGAVLADLCANDPGYDQAFCDAALRDLGVTILPQNAPGPLSNAIAQLQTSHRFNPDAGIGKIAALVRTGAADQLAQFEDPSGEVTIKSLQEDDLKARVMSGYAEYFAVTRKSADASVLLEAFDQFRVLSPVREGPYGVRAINDFVEAQLDRSSYSYYPGKPILVTRNDYRLKLFNGDIGVCVEHEGARMIAFRNLEGEINHFLPSRLPEHETCFAMTVHKSQGSEFRHVLLVLPPATDQQEDRPGRELLYTGITRARRALTLLGELDAELLQTRRRTTGLQERLQERAGEPEDEPAEPDSRGPQLSLL